MLDQYKKKQKALLQQIVDGYKEDIDALTQNLSDIDEKYRKLAEEEKAETKATIEYYTEQSAALQAQIEELGIVEDTPEAPAEKKTRTRRSKKAESEVPAPPEDATKVVDTLFPENNEPETEEVEDETEEVEDQGPEFDGAGFSDADNYPEGSEPFVEEDTQDTAEPFSDAEPAQAEEATPSALDLDWTNMVQEW